MQDATVTVTSQSPPRDEPVPDPLSMPFDATPFVADSAPEKGVFLLKSVAVEPTR